MATLTFWGGVGTVTGSKYLLDTGEKHILIDCGLFQGLKELRERNWQPPPFSPKSLDAVILTHAHIDHTGYLPRLVAEGYRKPIYCSKATAELLKILLPDSARLQEEEAEYRNRHQLTRHNPARPLYTEEDVQRTLELLRPIGRDEEPYHLVAGVTARLYVAGHLLGSRFIHLTLEDSGKTLLFSGDLGHKNPLILKDPAAPPKADYLFVESTYGDRLHDEVPPKEAIAPIIRKAAKRNSGILIPTFAVGRTQEILHVLRQLEDEHRIPILPVYVDSPMAVEATSVYQQLQGEYDPSLLKNRKLTLRTHNCHFTSARGDSRRINDLTGAHIILSASGMMTGGRILHHAQRLLPNPSATLIFVGYQGQGTTGRRILEGEKEVKMYKQVFPVRCHIERVEGFSSHPDYNEILAWLKEMPHAPRCTILTHGEPEASQHLAHLIEEELGWKTLLPQYGDTLNLE